MGSAIGNVVIQYLLWPWCGGVCCVLSVLPTLPTFGLALKAIVVTLSEGQELLVKI